MRGTEQVMKYRLGILLILLVVMSLAIPSAPAGASASDPIDFENSRWSLTAAEVADAG